MILLGTILWLFLAVVVFNLLVCGFYMIYDSLEKIFEAISTIFKNLRK